MEKVSVLIPCLNEEKGIGRCIDKVKRVFEKGIDGEIIVIDNGSTDRTAEISRSLGAKVIFEPKKGYGNAYLAGFKEAKGDIVVMGDGDNSYDFMDIPKLLKDIREGNDFVVGSRFLGEMEKGSMGFFRNYGNAVLRVLLGIHGLRLKETCTGFVAFRKEILSKLNLSSSGMEFSSEFLIKANKNKLKISEVPIRFNTREGKSKLNEFRDGMRHLKLLTISNFR